jgi:hypothetical protein
MTLTAERLREVLAYDALVIGRSRFRGVAYQASWLVWLYVTGEQPGHRIGHRDGDGANIRWGNLLPYRGKSTMGAG